MGVCFILGESPCILCLMFLSQNCAKQIVIRYYKNTFMIYENVIVNYDKKRFD